jgi:hypothetical protein
MSSVIHVALRIVILLGSGPAPDPAYDALQSATRQALGPNADVQIVSVASAMDEEQARRYARADEGLVHVQWSQDRRHVTLYFYGNGDTAARDIDFDAVDSESDKGSHLGLLIGTLFDAEEHERQERANTAQQATPAEQRAAPKHEPKTLAPERLRNSSPRSAEQDANAAPSRTASSAWTIEASASVAMAGSGGGLGANLGFGTQLAPRLWWHLLAGAQAGEVAAAQATTKTLKVASGVEWNAAIGPHFELGLRSDLLVNWMQVAHLSADDPSVDRKQRWNTGLDLLLCAGLRVSGSGALVASSGMELLSGETTLFTHGQRVATLTPVRWVSSVGFRVDY